MPEMGLGGQAEDPLKLRTDAEIDKLRAEAEALRRDGFWSPTVLVALVAGLGGLAAIVTAVPTAIIQWKVSENTIAEAKNSASAEVLKAKEEVIGLREQKLEIAKQSAQVEATKSVLEASVADLKSQREATARQLAEAAAQLAAILKQQQEVLKEVDTSALPAAVQAKISTVATELGAAARAAAVRSRLVYLQFKGEIERQTMRDLQSQLESAGYLVPGIERVAGSYNSSVRYFRPEDGDVANDIATQVSDFLRANCAAGQEPVQPVLIPGRADVQQIEVWVSGTCKAVNQGP